MQNVSANGLIITLNAFPSFPVLVLSQWADDSDPLDIPELEINGSAMGINGDLVTWSTPKPIEVKLSVIAGSSDDKNLTILFNLNRAARKKPSTNDTILMTVLYPDTIKPTQLIGGRCKAYIPSTGAASSGRKKSKTYSFIFESVLS